MVIFQVGKKPFKIFEILHKDNFLKGNKNQTKLISVPSESFDSILGFFFIKGKKAIEIDTSFQTTTTNSNKTHYSEHAKT